MSVLVNHVCMSHQEFEAYKQSLEACTKDSGWKRIHNGEKIQWTFPALIVTMVTFGRDEHGDRSIDYTHTSISKDKLLQVLGLSREEIKFEFEHKNTEAIPESFDAREI